MGYPENVPPQMEMKYCVVIKFLQLKDRESRRTWKLISGTLQREIVNTLLTAAIFKQLFLFRKLKA